MDEKTYQNNQLKRAARKIQKELGIKYTEALRMARENHAAKQDDDSS